MTIITESETVIAKKGFVIPEGLNDQLQVKILSLLFEMKGLVEHIRDKWKGKRPLRSRVSRANRKERVKGRY